MRISSIFVLFLFMSVGLESKAQMIGYSAELDTMLWETADANDPLADLAYYGVYNVYANFTDSTDVLSALYADVFALETPVMGIDAPCGCVNDAASSPTVDASNNSALFDAFPAYEFDSFWTIGMELSSDPGQLPSHIGMGSPSALCDGMVIDNGSVYVTGSTGAWPVNAVAGADLKVLIARVTTCGDFTIQSCAQVFVAGSQDSVTQVCPEPLIVLHEGCTEEGACNYNPNATTDDGTCFYSTGLYNCDGECNNDTDGDGVCDELEIEGCTGMEACNYNPEATDDDDSCFYVGDPCDDGFDLTEGDVIMADCGCTGYSCHDPEACNYSTDGIEDASVCSYISLYDITGNAEPYSQTLQVYTYTNTAGSSYEWTATGGDIVDGQGDNEVSIVWNVEGPGQLCVVETNDGGCSGAEVCFDVTVTLSSVDDMLGGTLDVFPVPATDNLHVIWTGPTVDNAFVVVRDAAGRNVMSTPVGQRDVLDISNLSSGSYMLEYTIPARGQIQRRILVQ